MDGFEFVQLIEAELKARKIKKEQFYKESGISSATMSQWRNRVYAPSQENIKKVESYLGITFKIVQKEKSPMSEDTGLNNELIDLFNQLSPADQARELAYLRERVSGQGK